MLLISFDYRIAVAQNSLLTFSRPGPIIISERNFPNMTNSTLSISQTYGRDYSLGYYGRYYRKSQEMNTR